MRRFKKRAKFHMIILPGHGRVSDDRVFEGDEYARYYPALLEELPAKAPTVVVSKVVEEPKPEPPVEKNPETIPEPLRVIVDEDKAEPTMVPATIPPAKVLNADILAKARNVLRNVDSVDDALDSAESTIPQRRPRGRPPKRK